MASYKSSTVSFYQEDVAHTFDGELSAHPHSDSVWRFKLWHKERSFFAWEGTLEELAEVILAGQAVIIEQQKQLQEIAPIGQS